MTPTTLERLEDDIMIIILSFMDLSDVLHSHHVICQRSFELCHGLDMQSLVQSDEG